MSLNPSHIASRHLAGEAHDKSVALMKFLSKLSRRLGVGEHVYVVGGAVRDFVLDRPIKDVDVVIDSVALGGRKDSEWFAKQVVRAIPANVTLTTNNYGVALLNVAGPWVLDGLNMQGEDIEIANARKESYGGEAGKGYKPHMVEPSTIDEDVARRELTYNTLLIRLLDLANGPDKKDIIDLTGCGLRDLEEGRMQCPAPPDKVFSDDPSRMIRVIKFALRYGHKLTPDTKAAIVRNADKLKRVPSSHLGQMLTQIVLKENTWKKALLMMAELGLLNPVREMLLSDKSFRSTLENYVKSQKMDMLFGLLDVGLPLGAGLRFLSPAEQQRLREITLGMSRDEAWEFLEMVKNPGNAYKDKKFAPSLAQQYGIKGRDMGPFMQQVMEAGRNLLLSDPSLVDNPAGFKRMLSNKVETLMRGKTAASKYDGIDFKPPESVANAAARGLEYRQKASPSNRGGLTPAEAAKEMDVRPPRTAKLLKTVWVVTDPTESSEIIDIMWQGDPGMVGRVTRGSLNWDREHPAFHDSYGTAFADATKRLSKLWKGQAPNWVMENVGQLRTAAPTDGKVTGNGTSVGLFIPIPPPLADLYPAKTEDKSPPHTTLLFVGEVPKGQEQDFIEVLTATLSQEPGPIRAWTAGVDSFVHPDKGRTVFYTPIRFSRDMGEVRDRLWVALEEAGFEVHHSFPMAFFPHATLAYEDGTYHEHGYNGEVPEGAWEFNTVQVWGLRKLYEIPFGEFEEGYTEFIDTIRRYDPDED